jgi:tripartite-type tricarboxylate transporter receptor subunit TctC
MRRLLCLAVVVLLGVLLALIPRITLGAAPFYEGKTIRIVVGVSAGGGFDNEARILSRHMNKYIPGKPTIIVENVTGAGGLISANQLYRVAAPDGLTIGHFNGGFLFAQVLEQPGIEFDARKFGYLGAVSMENAVLFVTKASGITSIEQFMASKTPVKLGGTGIGAYAPDAIIKIWKAISPMPAQLIGPYKGGADVRLACEGGELAGSVISWDAMKSAWGKRFETGEARVIMQAVAKPRPDLAKVPLDMMLAKTEEARQLIDIGIHLNNVFARPFVLGPDVPKERADILRAAFQKAMQDKEFIEEVQKAKLGVDPVSGEDVEKAVLNAFKTSRPLVQKLKDVYYK